MHIMISEKDIVEKRKKMVTGHMLYLGKYGSGKTKYIKIQIDEILDKTDDSVFVFSEDSYKYNNYLNNDRVTIKRKDDINDLKMILETTRNNYLWLYFDGHVFLEQSHIDKLTLVLKRARKHKIIVTLASVSAESELINYFDACIVFL